MSNYSSKDIIVQIKDNGGTLRTITAGLRAIGNVSIEAILQESTPFGASWATFLSTGIKKMAAITLGGFYDDAATTGLDVMFSTYQGNTRTGCVLTYGGGKTTTVDMIIQKYDRMPKVGAETEVQITLQPTGAVVEA